MIFSIYCIYMHSKHKADLHEKALREVNATAAVQSGVISAAEHRNKAGFPSPCGSLVTNNLLRSSLHGQTRCFQLLNAGNSDYKRVNSRCNSSILIRGGSLVKALGHWSERCGFKPWHCQAALLTSWPLTSCDYVKNKGYVTNTTFFGFIVT